MMIFIEYRHSPGKKFPPQDGTEPAVFVPDVAKQHDVSLLCYAGIGTIIKNWTIG